MYRVRPDTCDHDDEMTTLFFSVLFQANDAYANFYLYAWGWERVRRR